MYNDLHETSHAELEHRIQSVKEECIQICNASNLEFNSAHQMSPEEVREKTQSYIHALGAEVHHTDTPITTDVDVVVDQFLSEIKEKNKQLDELTIFTQAAVNDVQAKIDRLKNQITLSKEKATLKPKQNIKNKFRKNFKDLKCQLHNLLTSMYPEDSNDVMVFLGHLMQDYLNEQSSSYVAITRENSKVIEILLSLDLVEVNPYNKNEVKLNY